MPCVYGYNFLEPHNLLTSHLMQAFVRKCVLVWHASTSSHIVCGSGPWWHHYSLKKSRHCVPVCCIAHKTATKPINWFMKRRWIEDNLQGFLNHQFLAEPSLYILIAIYIHLFIGLHVGPHIISTAVGSVTQYRPHQQIERRLPII